MLGIVLALIHLSKLASHGIPPLQPLRLAHLQFVRLRLRWRC